MPLLEDVAKAAEVVHRIEADYQEKIGPAREELRRQIRLAHDEGIPLAAIGRAAGISRERARQLYHEGHQASPGASPG